MIISAIAEGAVLGDWEADKYKSDPKKKDKHIDTFALWWAAVRQPTRRTQ